MLNLLVSIIAKIAIVVSIIVIFLLITIINIKTKKPDYDLDNPDSPCFNCSKQSNCPIISNEEKEDNLDE